MTNLTGGIADLLNHGVFQMMVRAVLILSAGVVLAVLINRRARTGELRSTANLLIRPALAGMVLTGAVLWSLSYLGVDVSVLLGTAGVLTVALGFASQTSMSNLISGVFVMAEKPFVLGDVIEVDGTEGEVIAIDLISIKLRTFDNRLVRIPNETMLKAKVINTTYFEIRRYDLQLFVAYKEDIARVRSLLLKVADDNPLCLVDPNPVVIFLGYDDSAVKLQFSVWAKRGSYLDLRNSISDQVKSAMDAEGINIPSRHRTIAIEHVGRKNPMTSRPDVKS